MLYGDIEAHACFAWQDVVRAFVPHTGDRFECVLLVGEDQQQEYVSRLSELYQQAKLYPNEPEHYVGLFDGKTFTIALMNGDAILTAMTCCMAKTATGLPVVYVLLLAGNHKAHAAALQQSGLSVLSSL